MVLNNTTELRYNHPDTYSPPPPPHPCTLQVCVQKVVDSAMSRPLDGSTRMKVACYHCSLGHGRFAQDMCC